MIEKNFSSLLIKDEIILKQLDKHWMAYMFPVFYFVVFIGSCIFGLIYQSTIISILGDGLYWGIFCLYAIVSLSCIVFLVLSEYLDTIIVTNSRVISLERSLPFGREIQSTEIHNISEIHAETTGILPTLFGYGKVKIGYLGGNQIIGFSYAPNPSDVVNMIHEIRQEKVT